MGVREFTEDPMRLRRVWLGVCAAVIAVALFVTLFVMKPAMPDRIVLLTGPRGGAYHALGERYAEDLRDRGLEAEVVVTGGAIENLRRLAAGGDAVAFAPSTVGREADFGMDLSRVVALGAVGIEPLWVFFRSDLEISGIRDLAGLRVATGGTASVVDSMSRSIVDRNGIGGDVEFRVLSGPPVEALVSGFESGEIDAAFVTGGARSPVVEALLSTEGLRFLSLDRADAYAVLIPGTTVLRLPEGVLDLAQNAPEEDAQVLSALTRLVSHEGLHAAVGPMVLVSAENVRARITALDAGRELPSGSGVSFPLDPSARRYFSQGETGLSRYLPHEMARRLNHIGFLVIPVLTVVAVMLKVLPLGLRVWGEFRLNSVLRRLASVEKKWASGADRAGLLAELDRVDRATARMWVPRPVMHDYIDFRQFLSDMRERVESRDPPPGK